MHPSRPRGWFRTLTHWYSELLSWLLIITVAALVFPVTLQIFSRYTPLIPSYIWTEEMARFLLVWMVMLGAMLGIRESSHFVVDVWPQLGPRANAMVEIGVGFFSLIFAFVFVWWGWEFTRFAFNRISELAELPLWMIHIAWPVAGVTWVIFLGERMFDNFRLLSGREA